MSFAFEIIARSSIVLLLAATLSAMLHRSSAALRHAVWAAGLVSAVLLLLASALLPVLKVPVLPFDTSGAMTTMPMDYAAAADLPIFKPESRFVSPGIAAWEYGLVLIWATGFALVLRRLLKGLSSVHRLTQDLQPITDDGWQSLLDELRSEMSITRPVRLVTGGTFAPMTWGLLHSVILLPSAAVEWTDERRRVVLAHELAHVKRRDGVLQFLAQIACGLYWFNPLVWYAAARLRVERERACDDQVLNLGAGAHDYATHLVQVARATSRAVGYSHATISMANPSQLETRLRSILDSSRRRHVLSGTGAGVLLSVATILTTLTATVHLTAMPLPPLMQSSVTQPEEPARRVTKPATPEAQPRQAAPLRKSPDQDLASIISEPEKAALAKLRQQDVADKAFKVWLEQDVVYIISEQEKAAAINLRTDQERAQFIERFWLQRDPTPGTPENELKDEHYERMAYANLRFGWTKPGWTTDRGRILILHGKPDSIDDHPSGGNYTRPFDEGGGTTNTYPFQVWTYRYIDGIGSNVQLEFVDPGLNGEYRLSKDPGIH